MSVRTKILLMALSGMVYAMITAIEASGQDPSPKITNNFTVDAEGTNVGPSETLPAFRIKDKAFVTAYRDVVTILRGHNTCADFFGGAKAVAAFNDLAAQMTKTYGDKTFGIRMSGEYSLVSNPHLALRYRLFKKAEIDRHGPFFFQSSSLYESRVVAIGKFSPNTRETRVLMLLHELGHLIEVAPGHWLLPNDGKDEYQSQENTWTVAKHCEQVIRAKPAPQ